MIGLLLVTALISVVVEATLTDGQLVQGTLVEVVDEKVTIESRSIDASDMKQLRFEHDPVAAPTAIVQFRDQSLVRPNRFETGGSDGQLAKLDCRDGEIECRLDQVGSVRLFPDSEQLNAQWAEIRKSVASDDFLVVNKKGNLDYLAGTVLSISNERIAFEYGDEPLSIPVEKVAGLVFAEKTGEMPAAKMILRTVDGNIWNLRNLEYRDGKLKTMSAGGISHRLDMESVVTIEFVRSDEIFLSDLEPEKVQYQPFVPSAVAGESLSTLSLPRNDSSFDLSPLSLLGKGRSRVEYQRGLAMQSRSSIVYRLASKYQRFQSTVGIDPSAPANADLVLHILADGKERLKRKIRKVDEPFEVVVPVIGVNRIEILVDFGENMDIGDRLHLCDARVIE